MIDSSASSAEFELRREPAFVADRGRKTAIFQHAFERVKNFRAVTQRLRQKSARLAA